MTEISSNKAKKSTKPTETKVKKVEFFDTTKYPLDNYTENKLSNFRYYAKQELFARLDNISGLLIDCQHKQWSGVLNSLTETRIDLEGHPVDPNSALMEVPAISIEFEPKEADSFSITIRLDDAETLIEKVKRIFIAVIAGLDKAAKLQTKESEK